MLVVGLSTLSTIEMQDPNVGRTQPDVSEVKVEITPQGKQHNLTCTMFKWVDQFISDCYNS